MQQRRSSTAGFRLALRDEATTSVAAERPQPPILFVARPLLSAALQDLPRIEMREASLEVSARVQSP
jgi:hypothetical protein